MVYVSDGRVRAEGKRGVAPVPRSGWVSGSGLYTYVVCLNIRRQTVTDILFFYTEVYFYMLMYCFTSVQNRCPFPLTNVLSLFTL